MACYSNLELNLVSKALLLSIMFACSFMCFWHCRRHCHCTQDCEPEVYCIIIGIETVVVRCMLMCSCIQEVSRIEFSKYFLTFRSASACILFRGVMTFSGMTYSA